MVTGPAVGASSIRVAVRVTVTAPSDTIAAGAGSIAGKGRSQATRTSHDVATTPSATRPSRRQVEDGRAARGTNDSPATASPTTAVSTSITA